MNDMGREEQLTLRVLAAVEEDGKLTQRGLAKRLGVALGLANSYLKRCARKGLIKVQHIPPNRYAYYLTPAGFSEKTSLALKYFRSSLRFYQDAGREYERLFGLCAKSGWRQLVLAGATDLAEIAVLRAMGSALKVTEIYDPFFHDDVFLGFRVDQGETPRVAAQAVVVLTSIEHTSEFHERALRAVGEARVMVPEMLLPVLNRGVPPPRSD